MIAIVMFSVLAFIPIAAAEDYGDILLQGTETLTISGTSTCDNLTITDDATLIVESAYLQVRGIVRMSGNARLFVISGTMRVIPPALDESTIVIHITDNAMVNIKDGSNLLLEPQPMATNISYLLMEDYASFYIADSVFSGEQPAIINQSIETASVTAGVYLLSGYARWHVSSSYVTGRVSIEAGELTGRWFWFSLHQRSSLTVVNSDMELTGLSSSYTILKPVSGLTTIRDSRILGGTMEAEVTAEVVMDNVSFASKVDFKDQSEISVSNCNFEKDVSIGAALSLVEVGKAPETRVEISDSTFEKSLRCEGNSTTSIMRSDFESVSVRDNATVSIKDSNLASLLAVRGCSHADVTCTLIPTMISVETASVILEDVSDLASLVLYGTEENASEVAVYLKRTDIGDMILYPDFSSTLSFENANLVNVSFYNEVTAEFECIDTSISELRRYRSGENVSLVFVNVNSDLPDFTGFNTNVSVTICHRLGLSVVLNNEPVETEVSTRDEFGFIRSGISFDGSLTFDLPYKTLHNGFENITELYNVQASYLGFSETRDVELTSSMDVTFSWEDEAPPEVSEVSLPSSGWSLGKDITIRATANDLGVMVIADMTLHYRVDDGPWKETKMFRVGEGMYEGTIPKRDESSEITYYIEAQDSAGNAGTTEQKSITVGQEEDLLFVISLIAAVFLIFIVVARSIVIHRKVRAYTHKYNSERLKND